MLIEIKLAIQDKTQMFFRGEKVLGGEKGFSSLLEKYTSVACLLMSGLNNIFH